MTLSKLFRVLPPLLAATLFTTAAHAGDGDEPHCGDGKRAAIPRVCGQFEAAPKLAADDPLAQKVLGVWRRVSPAVEALSGRQSAIAVLAADARMTNGEEFPPTAYICPGAPPTVYVPHTLVTKVFGPNAKYPEDFLGFVLGHELGHRINDFTADGCQLGAFERPGRGIREEALADFRGAFFAAVGGYSTRSLAREETVSEFLKDEFKVREPTVKDRAGALLDALEDFDAYEGLYDAAVALTFAGEVQTAKRLLGWADELVDARGVPLPELKVVRALALMMGAADDAPWLENVEATSVPMSHLRCQAVLPAHTALWEEPGGGRVRGPGEARDRARRDLEQAKALLKKAAELGANHLVTDSGLACAAFYLGDVGEAQRYARRAERRLTKRSPASVKDALAANAALLAFGKWTSEHPAPGRTEREQASAWAKALKKEQKAFTAHTELTEVLGLLERYPDTPRPKRRRARPAACEGKGAKATPLPAAVTVKGAVGECPAGWTAAFSVPAPEIVKASGTGMGVTSCHGPDGRQVLHVRLPSSLDPAYDEVDTSLELRDVLPDADRSLDAWACACDALQAQGVTDRGDRTWLAACPDLGVPLGVVFSSPDGRVRRVAILTTP